MVLGSQHLKHGLEADSETEHFGRLLLALVDDGGGGETEPHHAGAFGVEGEEGGEDVLGDVEVGVLLEEVPDPRICRHNRLLQRLNTGHYSIHSL